MAASLIAAGITAGGAWLASKNNKDAAEDAANAANQASKLQAQKIQEGVDKLEGLTGKAEADIKSGLGKAQNYLKLFDPYVESGEKATGLLDDILGTNGADAQASALETYKSSPSAQLLQDVIANTVRTTQGEMASQGLSKSGAMTESLGRRLSDVNLTNYYNWENLAKGLSSQGLNAAGSKAQLGSNNEMNAASNLANLKQNLGSNVLEAYSRIGGAQASGVIGGANARLAGAQASNNALQYGLGQLAKTDFSKAFGNGGGGDVGMGSWLPTVMMGA